MDFTVQLALVDALPVLLFGIAAVALGLKLHSGLFFAGAVVCLLAGSGKVLWKLILALCRRDVAMLNKQLRLLMPMGFILMIAGIVTSDRALVKGLLGRAIQMPSILFFALSAVGMVAMVLVARKQDMREARANWIEQIINSAVQGCVMVGVLLM